MKIILIGLTLLTSISTFAVDCDCYAEVDVLEGRHNDSLQYSNREIHLGSYNDIYFYEVPLAKLSCSSKVSDWAESTGDIDASSNLECGK